MKKEIDVLTLITSDEYANKGGSYIIDPKTGKRVPAEQYNEQQAPQQTTVTDQPLIDEEIK